MYRTVGLAERATGPYFITFNLALSTWLAGRLATLSTSNPLVSVPDIGVRARDAREPDASLY